MANKLTKKTVDELQLPEKGQNLIWDNELKGFGIRLTPTGKTYIVQARVNGKSRRTTIGKHGPFTPHNAREKALKILHEMADGIDPATKKAQQKAFYVTLMQVADEYKKDRQLKKSSQEDIDKHLAGIFKDWTDKPVTKITRQMVLKKFRDKSETSKAQANQAFRILRALFNYARATYRPDDKPILPENPCQVLSDAKMWHEVQAKKRRIPTDKIGKAWVAIQEMMTNPGRTFVGQNNAAAIGFALLTGARWGEVSSLSRDRVNLEERYWTIPDPKNKQPIILPLSNQSLAILEYQNHDGEFFFSGRGASGHVGKPIRAMKTLSEAVGVHLSAHDLRRTFRAICGEIGIEFWRTKLLMNHKLDDVTINSYTETSDLRYLSGDSQKIGDWIERQGKIAASGNITDLEQTKRKKMANV